jgi:hypothetical protein
MLLNTNPNAPPAFLSPNRLTRHADNAGDLALTSGVDLRHRLYDMDPAAIWQGEHNDDAFDETATFGLWLPGFQSSYDIDFLAVLGHNLKAFDWDLSDDNGGTYPGGNRQTKTLLAESDTIVSLANAIAFDKALLTMHTTQTANDYKQVGALVVASVTLQAAIGMSLFKPHPLRVKDNSAVMYDNSKRVGYIYRSDASIGFRDFSLGFSGLSESEADDLEAAAGGPDAYIFYPRPGDRKGKMYYGRTVPDTFYRGYDNLAAGTEAVTFEFEEIGGA